MGNFQTCLDATAPLLLYLAAGYLARRLKQIDSQDVSRFNSVVFNFFLTVNQFKSIYFSDLSTAVRPGLILFSALGVLTSCGIGLALSSKLLPREQRGVMTQGIFRSNFVLIGLYIAETLVPDGSVGSVAVLGAIVLPLFNVLAVVVLTAYSEEKNLSWRDEVRRIFQNPLILGALAGFAAVLLRQLAPSVFDLPQTLPSVYKVCGDLSRAASPLVLVILGARLRFDAVQGLWKKITAAVAMRLVVVPGIVLTLAVLLRDPLGITAEEMPTVVAIFCSPVAVTSAVMVQEIGGDEQLAQQVVAWSSALSMVTIFCFASGLRAMGVM